MNSIITLTKLCPNLAPRSYR